MRCPSCQSEQDQRHFYCDSCGHDLHHPERNNQHEALPEINFTGLVDQTVDEIRKQAHTVELETLEKIQERAARWAKTNLFFLGLASSVLVLAFSFFGYRKITDLEKLVAESSQNVAKLVAETAQTTEKAKLEATASLQKAVQLKKEIEQINLKSIQTQLGRLKNLEAQLDRSVAKADKIRKQVMMERQNVQKLQHSFFSISLHLDGSREQLSTQWNSLVQALNDRGFQLNRANIVELGVNRTEVLYYNSIAEGQAEQIATIVQRNLSLPRVQSRMIPMLERKPREILVKIKLP